MPKKEQVFKEVNFFITIDYIHWDNFTEPISNPESLITGKIVTLFETGSQIMFSPQPAIRKLKRKLKDFNDNDYLLMMGDPAAMGIACCVAAEMNRGKFKILKWDKKQQRYYPVSVNLNEKGEIDER